MAFDRRWPWGATVPKDFLVKLLKAALRRNPDDEDLQHFLRYAEAQVGEVPVDMCPREVEFEAYLHAMSPARPEPLA